MIRIYNHDPATGQLVYRFRPGVLRTLIGQGDNIDAMIDRAIESLPPDADSMRFEAVAKAGVVSVAFAFKTKSDWTVVLAGERAENGALEGRVTVTHVFS